LDVEIVEGDILDSDVVDEQVKAVDGVFHLAGHVGNVKSIEEPIKDARANVEGTLNLLESARENDIEKFIYSSSAAIFGEVQYTPVDESHSVEPDSPYGVTKLAGEKHALCYSRIYDLDVVALRYFNVYGVNQYYDEYGNVIPIWAHNLLNDEPLVVYGDGKQTRDFIDVRDVAQANICAYESDEAGGPYNVGAGEATKIVDLAELMISVADSDIDIVHEPPRDGEVRHSVADINHVQEDMDFSPDISLEDGVKEYIEWLEAQ
jgi:UDP-glucose 4-epimerase